MRASLRTIPPADSYSLESVITLDQIRRAPRRTNDYVDTPRPVAALPSKPPFSSHSPTLFAGGVGTGGGTSPRLVHQVHQPVRVSLGSGRVGGGGGGVDGGNEPSVVSLQPVSKPCPLKSNTLGDASGVGDNTHNGDSVFGARGTSHRGVGERIICDKCHKCQCSDCTDTKPLPSHWCCRNVCEVSPEKVLDACTCFCCVKFALYHFGNDEEYENPCGCCSSPHCMRRWTLMTVMALCLPCLWTYWPARGCLAACTAVYNQCWRGRKGCDCQGNVKRLDPDIKSSVLSRGSGVDSSGGTSGGGGGTSKNSQSRRLLIESDSSSTST